MAFPQEPVRTPHSISDIDVTLHSPDPTGPEQAGATFVVRVRLSDGSMREIKGNLVPHLTQQQINGLLSFMADMRIKANAEILP